MLHELRNRRSITFVLLGGFAWILLNLSAQTTVWYHADFLIVFQDPSTDCLPLLFPGGRFILPLINNRLSHYTNIETTLRRRIEHRTLTLWQIHLGLPHLEVTQPEHPL